MGFAYLVCHSGSLVTCDGTVRQGLEEQRQPAQDVRDITDQCNSRLGTDQRRKDWPPGLGKGGYYVNVSVHVGRGLSITQGLTSFSGSELKTAVK